MSLVVPIFNNNQYRNNMAVAQLELAAAQAAYRQTAEDCKQRLFVAALDYQAAYRKFGAAQRGYRAALEENHFAAKELQLGPIGAVDYGEVQARLATAASELLQNKYDCYFKLQMWEQYKKSQ